MKTISTLFLSTALLASLALKAQTFEIRPIITRDNIIGGQALDKCLDINDAAVNDKGEVAFSANCYPTIIFTPKRVVANYGDRMGNLFITMIPTSMVAINNRGQVAYQAYTADSASDLHFWRNPALFVEDHLAMYLTDETISKRFILSDDGLVSFTTDSNVAPPAQNNRRGQILGRIHANLPRNLPIGIDPRPSRPTQPRQTAAEFPMLRPNTRGQFVIPVNLPTSEFVILLATPRR